jgi:hypothetical protein
VRSACLKRDLTLNTDRRLAAPRPIARRSVDELAEWRIRGLHALRHNVGEIAIDAEVEHQQLVDQSLIGIDIVGDDLEDVIHAAARCVT